MAVFRIEKTRDYTVMSNHHLKDRRGLFLTCAPAPIMKPCINLPSAARKRIGWWGSTPRAFSPFSITAP